MLHSHHYASQSKSLRCVIRCAIAVSTEKIIVSWEEEEEIIDTEYVRTVSYSHIIEHNSWVLKVKNLFMHLKKKTKLLLLLNKDILKGS